MNFHDELGVILDREEYCNYSSFYCGAEGDCLFSFFFLPINWNSSVKKGCALYPISLFAPCPCQSLSRVQLFATPWTVACQEFLQSLGIPQARILEWAAMLSSRGSPQPRYQTCVSYASHISRRFFTTVQVTAIISLGLPWQFSGRESTCQRGRLGFDSLGREGALEREWQSLPLPGKSHGQKGLVGYSPWCRKEWDMTQQLNNNKNNQIIIYLQLTFFLMP